ncbi:MAG: FixH family protein [Gammaproteobacteria bacterium]|nr:FixH family protein [Gammaproteobacteria bacterium]
MQREDTLPWYRQFWPWFIIALPASAVVAGLYTVWIAMQTSDSLVINSDDGVNVVTERNLAAERSATDAGVSAGVAINSDTGSIVVTLSSDKSLAASTSLTLQLLHPTLATRDAEAELLQGMPGQDGKPVWVGHFVSPPKGRYYVVLASGDAWRLSGEWSGESLIRMGAAADGGP